MNPANAFLLVNSKRASRCGRANNPDQVTIPRRGSSRLNHVEGFPHADQINRS
jgi:hypothetical protein